MLLGNVFERCVEKQLIHHFSPYLPKFLSAYSKGNSREVVLLRLTEDCKKALDNNYVIATVIMD